jgi:hypothetical protein
MQSPAVLQTYMNPATYMPGDWSASFAFLTGFYPGTISADEVGVTDYVYTVKPNATNDLGGFYAGEPLFTASNRVVFWKVSEMRFHFPAEHAINGTTYDAEFQIVGDDVADTAYICTAKQAALSLMIKVDDSKAE